MKTRKIFFAIAAGMVAAASGCSADLLNVESKTAPTSSFLYNSPEGLQKAVIGLYSKDRSFILGSDATNMYIIDHLDYCTDLMVFRGGTEATFARLNNFKPESFKTYWKEYYTLIGKANEVIAAAENIGIEKPGVSQPYGEACLFRAKSYLRLYQRFERLYLNLEPTTVDNAFGRTFRAASKEEIFTQIKKDLDAAIANLDWKYDERGRLNKAVAKHVRAQVAMWEEDWDTAFNEANDIIFGDGAAYFGFEANAIDVFQGEDYTSSEVLYAYQFSKNPGGGNTITGGLPVGHVLALNVTPAYQKMSGMVCSTEYGGYGWGRVYPNTHLLSLYDKARDRRYKDFFAEGWTINDKTNPNYGQPLVIDKSNYLEKGHIYNVKHIDKWTNQDLPDRRSGFRDVLEYRLAETALIGAEASVHKGDNENALKFFNKTYERALGAAFTGTVTMQDILDETARELNFEGVRWFQLKRLGLLEEYVTKWAGDSKEEDPKLPNSLIEPRQNFKTYMYRWAIPQSELDLMPGFGQTAGWM